MKNLLWYITAASALCSVSSLSERRYHFIYEPKSWTEAQSYCREKYTDLVTADNLDIVKMLYEMGDPNKLDPFAEAWIGLYRDETIWKWLSDYNPNFSNWASGQPDNLWYRAGCGGMYSTGKWHDAYCEELFTLVCSNVT
ncbi:L-selectin-like, partial [Cyprinodon tularosa]|uniref:L-selectin-like n=1 Tax=Cyprinodon tularosa TaxID=77115 RepID=UPI0018E267A1